MFLRWVFLLLNNLALLQHPLHATVLESLHQSLLCLLLDVLHLACLLNLLNGSCESVLFHSLHQSRVCLLPEVLALPLLPLLGHLVNDLRKTSVCCGLGKSCSCLLPDGCDFLGLVCVFSCLGKATIPRHLEECIASFDFELKDLCLLFLLCGLCLGKALHEGVAGLDLQLFNLSNLLSLFDALKLLGKLSIVSRLCESVHCLQPQRIDVGGFLLSFLLSSLVLQFHQNGFEAAILNTLLNCVLCLLPELVELKLFRLEFLCLLRPHRHDGFLKRIALCRLDECVASFKPERFNRVSLSWFRLALRLVQDLGQSSAFRCLRKRLP
mmetsp:Transcript_6050/g.10086  ORF Transcript_6050/g.10086 Transcript_6050/m.10086 type:complete len:325 (-) Transcript_6050:612-1586(-)